MIDERSDAAGLDAAGKRALLARLLREERRPAGPVPLSFAQRRLWLLDRVDPGQSTYNVAFAVRLRGGLNVAALESALGEVVRRHDLLRSVVTLQDGEPAHVVDPSFRLALPLVELERTDEAARAAELASLLAAEGARPFDLRAGPAIRALLVRASTGEHVLSVVIHHIVTDGWSSSVFNRELGAFYNAYTSGTSAALPELRATWADFVAAERERASGERLENRLRYWKGQLSGAPPALELFPLRPAPATRTSRGRSTSRPLAAETAAGLERLCRARRTTLFATLLAALVALLHRYCGSRDIVIGTAGANRTRSEYEDLIGFFVNTVALRTRIEGDPAFCDQLAHVQRTAIEAFDDRDVPFEKLIEELHPARTASRTPLVNVMFVLQNTPGCPLAMDGLDVTPVALERSTAKFDLTFEVKPASAGFELSLEYSTDLFEPASATALLEAYEALLAGVADDCEQTLSQLALLSPAGMHAQTIAWNDTARALPGYRLERHFEAAVERRPDATALVAGTERLTYRELNERANRLARRLLASGVRRGSRVGLCAERGPAMVAGILAILKAGAAYVPLDPEYPRERLAFMARDAEIDVVLAERRFFARLKTSVPGASCIDFDSAALERFAETNLASDGTSDDLAYLMYTSGSTGTPKGVLIPHRAVERLVIEPNYVSIAAGAVVAQASTFSFDASTFEVWGALCNGATLVVVPKLVALSARALAAFIATQRIGIMFVTTSLFAEIVREAPATFRDLSYLLIGGEALGAAPVAQLLESEPPPNVVNMYGPTEATTFAAFHRIAARPAESLPIPIGRPIANTYLRVLDERHALLPAGACGELYVGGPGLALGYANDPERTARAFIRDPYSTRPADRLYATGDRVRYLPSGALEFLGRSDGQVKVRGFRIEPAEVEAALRACSGVHDAVVTVHRDPSGNAKLVAYVTAGSEQRVDAHDVARTLRERLPAHMVPEAIVPLRRFPITATGKVDRAALPAPGARATESPAAQPSSELHVQLVALWQRLLDVEQVGIRDDFFALGGHSLLAARMVTEVDNMFGTQLALSVLFKEPTIERLADALQAAPESLNRAPLVRLNDGGKATPLFFLHGSLTGGGYYCNELARRLGDERPLYVLRPHGLDGRPLPETIEAMAAEYVAIVKATQPAGPYLLGGYCSGGLVAYQMAQILRARGDDVASVVLIDPRDPRPALSAVANAIERLLPGPAARAVRSRTARSVARVGFHLNRFAMSPSKSAFLRERGSRFAARFAGVPRGVPREDALRQWRRITDAFVPLRYDGRLTVLTSQEVAAARGSNPLRWRSISRAELHVIPGGHSTCLTDCVADVAAHIARALERA